MNTRVLMIGAHPDDEDTNLITWLQRGRYVTTAYLSLTRGDGGQNIIGNELGEALGVIRTGELLAARRIDGAQQFFTRAFDFGFSKDTIDTFKHWTRDSILGDVVRVVRGFRPHVIVAVFSGTPRDGHGHHQVSGLLARAAYDIAGDTVRFPTRGFGSPWTALKFYRAARGNQTNGTLGMNVGEYSPLLGRSYAEIAGESRSQHKSQGFGSLERKGPIMNYVRREASRVNEATASNTEASLFDGIDTSWARFRGRSMTADARLALESLPEAIASVKAAYNPFEPWRLVAPLWRVRFIAGRATRNDTSDADLIASINQFDRRNSQAILLASGVAVEAGAPREIFASGDSARFDVTIYNRGRDSVALMKWSHQAGMSLIVPPGGVVRDTFATRLPDIPSQPWWLPAGRSAGMFLSRPSTSLNEAIPRQSAAAVRYILLGPAGPLAGVMLTDPVAFRYADQVKGAMERPVVAAPAITVSIDQQSQYAAAGSPITRDLEVRLRSANARPRDVRVTLALPRGLTADSVSRGTQLGGYDATIAITFKIRGQLAAGSHRVDVLVESEGQTFATGYETIDYDHITRQRIYRPASVRLTAVDARVPAALRVAYISGMGDNVAPALAQLGVPVTVIPPSEVARADLKQYTTVVIGPRAYEAHPELLAANPKLFDFARKGGVLMVQYGQYEMTQPGATPFPFTINRPHDRVTHEDAPVTIETPGVRELTFPNRITPQDFDGWVQERGLYMPRTFDAAYRALLSMNDPNEAANKGGILVAPLGNGLYIYTSLSFFRQLPAGVPGAARLFVNLLSANLAPSGVTP